MDAPADAQAPADGTQPPPPGYDWSAYVPSRPVPRVVVKADLLPAVSVLSTVALLGLVVGWIWSRMAPPQVVRLIDPTQRVPLTAEDFHPFDDLALYGMLALAAGIVTGVAVWMLRERRGPVILIAAVLGGVVAAWLGMRTGISWAQGRYELTGAPKVGDVIAEAPKLTSNWVILAWPFATALVYGALAAWNSTDDLGRRLG